MKAVIPETSLIQTSLSFLLIIVLIFLVAYFLKKAQQVNWRKSANLQIIGGLNLGAKERLLIVRTHGKHLLIGVTANAISKIDDLEIKSDDATHAESQSFMNHLKNALKREP